MADAHYYRPHEEGPLFPDDARDLVDGATTLLAAVDRDVEEAVATQDIQAAVEDSWLAWVGQKLQELGLTPPGEAQ